MPFSTEHQATCRYSNTITQCPMPSECINRIPPNLQHLNTTIKLKSYLKHRRKQSKGKIYPSGVCGKIPIVRTEGSIYDW